MKAKISTLVLVFTGVAALALADPLLAFVDGEADFVGGGEDYPAYTGDSWPEGSELFVYDGSTVEVEFADRTVFLRGEGTYSLADIGDRVQTQTNFLSAAGGKLGRLFSRKPPVESPSAVGGVRGDDQSGAPELDWMGDEGVGPYLDDAVSMLDQGDGDEALALVDEARLFAYLDEELAACDVVEALVDFRQNKFQEADDLLRTLNATAFLEPEYRNYAAWLFLQLGRPENAVSLFEDSMTPAASGPEIYLLAVAYSQTGAVDKAQAAAERGAALSDEDLGSAFTDLLESLPKTR